MNTSLKGRRQDHSFDARINRKKLRQDLLATRCLTEKGFLIGSTCTEEGTQITILVERTSTGKGDELTVGACDRVFRESKSRNNTCASIVTV